MTDPVPRPAPLHPIDPDDAPAAGEVESAGRSCLVIILLGVVLLLVVCLGVAGRWVLAQ